jgi:hypothetical protein
MYQEASDGECLLALARVARQTGLPLADVCAAPVQSALWRNAERSEETLSQRTPRLDARDMGVDSWLSRRGRPPRAVARHPEHEA